MAVASEVGDGSNTLFWEDRWLHGQRICDLAPLIYTLVPRRIAKNRTVAEALVNMRWVQDITGIVSVQLILEFLSLSELIAAVPLRAGVPDKHCWRLSSSGCYSAKSAYAALFEGSVLFSPWERVWKSWAPNKCRFFMWLVAHNRCWTADRLACRNLPHPARCPLCDQDDETINHLLTSCVFASQFWFLLLQRGGFANLAPGPSDNSLDDWWNGVIQGVPNALEKGLNSLVILGAWTLWRHRNDCVFNGAVPRVSTAIAMAKDEAWAWCMAGAKDLSLVAATDLESAS